MHEQSTYGEEAAICNDFQVIFGGALERMSGEEMEKSYSMRKKGKNVMTKWEIKL